MDANQFSQLPDLSTAAFSVPLTTSAKLLSVKLSATVEIGRVLSRVYMLSTSTNADVLPSHRSCQRSIMYMQLLKSLSIFGTCHTSGRHNDVNGVATSTGVTDQQKVQRQQPFDACCGERCDKYVIMN